jgi:hypothetical protein
VQERLFARRSPTQTRTWSGAFSASGPTVPRCGALSLSRCAQRLLLLVTLNYLADRLDAMQILAFRGVGLRKDGSWDLELAAGDAGFVSMRIRAPEISENSVQARAEVEALIFITSIEVVVGGRSSGGEEPEQNEECLSIVAKAVPADHDDAAVSSPSKAAVPGNTPTISPEKAVSGAVSRQGGRGVAV